MRPSKHGRTGILFLGFVASAGCAWLIPRAKQDPQINFAAHTVSRGVVVDKMDGDQNAALKLSSSPSGPQFVLQTAGGSTTAALWSDGSTTFVRSTPDSTTPVIGTVDSSSDDHAIRFTLKPAGGGSFSTSLFKRIEGGVSPGALGQSAYSLVDLRGVYRADVADEAGNHAGWMRVRVGSRGKPAHIYDGVLPEEINGPLAVAVVAQLDATLNAVEAAAYNPYLGN
jgi:hypothetical protein